LREVLSFDELDGKVPADVSETNAAVDAGHILPRSQTAESTGVVASEEVELEWGGQVRIPRLELGTPTRISLQLTCLSIHLRAYRT
jgi:hypothetical protein